MVVGAHDAVSGAEELTPAADGARRLHPVLAWMVCMLRHRASHRWYPRYLAGYGVCMTCRRQWA